MRWKTWLVLMALAVFFGPGTRIVHAQKIYWTELLLGEIKCADLDGGNMEVLYGGLNYPYFFELDEADSSIYSAENYNTVVHVSHMDGSGLIETLDIGLLRIRDIGLDLTSNRLYWGDRESHTIHRCNLDGSGGEILYDANDGLVRPHGMALDTNSGMIYWADTMAQSINRGIMDGSSDVEVLYDGLVDPWDVELDLGGGKIYWVDRGGATICRGDMDGSGPLEELLSSADGLDVPQGLGLDIASGKMYWADSGLDIICRANLDGSFMEVLVTTGLNYPADLELALSETQVDIENVPVWEFSLQANTPNPFNPRTTINFNLAQPQVVDILMYNVSGRLVSELISGKSYDTGRHQVTWDGRGLDGRDLPSGSYVVRLETESGVQARKVSLIR